MAKPWMPLYVADYLADTQHLSAQEHGAYLLLLMYHWQHGSIPADDKTLSRIACVHPPHWPKVKTVLMQFFDYQDPGVLTNRRMEQELRKAHEISSKRKLSAQQMHSVRKAHARANAEQMHTHARARHSHIYTSLPTDSSERTTGPPQGATDKRASDRPSDATRPELDAMFAARRSTGSVK